jgi:stress response protein SCP2
VRLVLADLSADVSSVFVAASTEIGAFGDVGGMTFRVVDPSGTSLVRYEVEPGDERAMVVAELYRRAGGRKVRAVGQGWSAGLSELAPHLASRSKRM